MIGGRHKSNCELVALGIANISSIIFGGIPATGVIARTAANVKSGGRTPLAGMVHSVTLLLLMILLAPYASRIPLAALAAILVMVAWNMAEIDHFKSIFRAARRYACAPDNLRPDGADGSDQGRRGGNDLRGHAVHEAHERGHQRRRVRDELDESGDEFADLTDPNSMVRRDVPIGVEVYEINGPFFFGVADRLKDTLRSLEHRRRCLFFECAASRHRRHGHARAG